MSRELIIGNDPFQYPDPGDPPGWGEGSSDWASAVTEAIASVIGPDDILQTSFSIANNISSYTNVNGLIFSNSTVRAAFVEYSIYRTTNSNELAQSGTLEMVYKNTANDWTLVQDFGGEAGVIFSITSSGQLQYQSSNVSGTSYSGVMKFKAQALAQ